MTTVAEFFENLTEDDDLYYVIVALGGIWYIGLVTWAIILATMRCFESLPYIEVAVAIYFPLVAIFLGGTACLLNGLCGPGDPIPVRGRRGRQIFLVCGTSIAALTTAYCGVYQHKSRSCPILPASDPPTVAPTTVQPPGTFYVSHIAAGE